MKLEVEEEQNKELIERNKVLQKEQVNFKYKRVINKKNKKKTYIVKKKNTMKKKSNNSMKN